MVITQEVPDYPEYEALHTEARLRSLGFVNPADIRAGGRYDEVAYRRGVDWCVAVLGGAFPGVLRLTHLECELLVVADERGVDPPLPDSVIAARQETQLRRDTLAAERRDTAERDDQVWRCALEAATANGVQLQVYENTKARARRGELHNLGHAVPTSTVYSGRSRVHQAGYALCETATRAKSLQLKDEPSDAPATCDRCVTWTPKVRPIP